MQTKFPYRYAVYYNNTLLMMLNRTDEINVKTKHTFVYENKIYRIVWVLPKIYVDENYYIIPCSVICLGNVRYKWVANCTDGSWENESTNVFTSKEECYNDMRNNALEKMKWNTEFEHDFEDDTPIDYKVSFTQDEIRHESYSGLYIYKIVVAE